MSAVVGNTLSTNGRQFLRQSDDEPTTGACIFALHPGSRVARTPLRRVHLFPLGKVAMASSVAAYKKDLDHLGTEDFLRLYPWPVLVVTSIAGVLKGLGARGTVITELPDLTAVAANPGRVFSVTKGRNSEPGPITIGRTSENDVTVNEYSVSTRHAILALVNGEYRLTDLGATNGTLVNGVRMVPRKPCRLQGGETLQLGRVTLLFLSAKQFAEHLARGTLSAP
jgi:hypothetical protein